jgi:DNA-binding transcriptional ArsR family regulator
MPEAYVALQGLAQAFAHRTRLRILDILARDEACVCHLTTILGEAQAHVSQHLRVLRDNGLVVDRRDGVMVYYRLADARAAAIVSLLKDLQRACGPELGYLNVPLAPVDGCPCPHCAAVSGGQGAEGCC